MAATVSATIGGFDDIETVDCAGIVNGIVKGGLLIFGISPDGEFRHPVLYFTIPLGVGRIRPSGWDIYLWPTECSVAKPRVVAKRLFFA